MTTAERAQDQAQPDDRTMRERMEAGDLYIADDPELGRKGTRARDLMDAYNATTVRQGPLRRQLLEALLASVGEDTEIRPPFYVDYGSNITAVGAGAVVTKDLPADVVAVGNPARVVRRLDAGDPTG